MDRAEHHERAPEESGVGPATAPMAVEDVPDPEEDNLDDLDGTKDCHSLSPYVY